MKSYRKKNNDIFITGIDTNAGKTVVSAILTEALRADYWKPVQTGSIENTDTKTVKKLVQNDDTEFHEEVYLFREPVSPHAAAKMEKKSVSLTKIKRPNTKKRIIIEGAGGVFTPLNNKYCIIDLIEKLNSTVIVVSKNYLGSINHTILTVEALKKKQISIAGIVFVGEKNPETEKYILQYTKLKLLFRIEKEKKITKEVVLYYANKIINSKTYEHI